MPSENTHQRKEKRTFTVVLVPGDESKQPKTFSVGRYKIVALSILTVVLVVSIVFSLIVFTPLGRFLPISHPELEQQYTGKIADIQRQMQSILYELTALKSYNQQLRKALGDKTAANDSVSVPGRIAQSGELMASRTSADRFPRQPKESMPEANRAPAVTYGSSGMTTRTENPEKARLILFPLITPTLGYVTRGLDVGEGHLGIDFAGKEGNPVVASAEGNVIFSDWSYDFGYMMIIAHGQGYTTVYKHNRSLIKNVGALVKRGEVVAFLGNTGRTSSGPHLHFEVWKDGIALNPANYLLTVQ